MEEMPKKPEQRTGPVGTVLLDTLQRRRAEPEPRAETAEPEPRAETAQWGFGRHVGDQARRPVSPFEPPEAVLL